MSRHEPFDVMFFLPQLGGGGAEMNAVRLAPGLRAAGVRPIYVVGRGPGSYAHLLPSDVEVIVLDTGRINSSTLRVFRARPALAALIDARRPDVLCPSMPGPSLAAFAALRLSSYRPAVVPSLENSLSVSHGGSWRPRERLELWLMCRSFTAADGIIVKSHGVAQEVSDLMPSLADRVAVVPNVAIPLPDQTAAARAEPRPAPGPDVTILACGRLTRQKDYPTLLRAFAQLRGAGAIRLDVLGEGELRGELEATARALGVAERVRFLGFRDDPYRHMRRADIFVLSSRWEGFGMVLVEAMAMGAPVVATDCPHGPAEIVEDGRTGLLVPPGRPDALAGALQRFIDDPALRARLAAAGEVRARDFGSDAVGAAFAERLRAFAGAEA